MITIVDYGLGNLGSVLNMLRRLGVDARISSEPREVRQAEKIILPGVGAFDEAMRNLASAGMAVALEERVSRGVPILGICLGAQLMTRRSDEGTSKGLAWVAADTVAFRQQQGREPVRVPHMGWTDVSVVKHSPLFGSMVARPRFYFVHSYHFVCDDPADVLSTSVYGYEFVSAFERGNVAGVQFHPEKSHKFGMRLLAGFAEKQ